MQISISQTEPNLAFNFLIYVARINEIINEYLTEKNNAEKHNINVNKYL